MSDLSITSRKRLQQVWWGVMLALAVAVVAVGAVAYVYTSKGDSGLPSAVRIASVSYQRGGKSVLQGTPAIVARQGVLASELRKRGLELQWVPAPHTSVAATINEAFANDRIDFASYGDLPSIIVNAGGVRTRLIVPSGRGSDTHLVVPNDSSARSIEDLKGKRIALHRGRPWELPFQRLLDSKGLKYEDFSVLNLNPEAATAAIIAKKVDAMYTMSDAYVLEHRGVAKIIWSTESAPPDWKLRAELWGISAFVDKHPELTQLVANAFVQAAHWASLPENRDEVVKLATVSGTPASSVRRAQDNVKPYRDNWSPLFDEPLLEHYRQATRQAFDKRMVATQLDFAEMHDDRFVRAALTQLGLGTYWQPAGSSAVLSPRLRQ